MAPPTAFRERGGQGVHPSSVRASRPLRSSPLAGPAFSSNPSISSSGPRQSQSSSVPSSDVRPYARSTPSSITSHAGSSSSSFSSHAHRSPGTLAGPSKSTGSIPTLSAPSSLFSHTGSISTNTSSSSSHAHSTSGSLAQVKSTSSISSLFRRQAKDDPLPPLPTQAPFGHNRSTSFTSTTVPTPVHIPQTYSPRTPRPSTAPGPSVSRNPNDNWMSSAPFGPASTPRFSRQSMSSQPVVMPLSAREYQRQKRASITIMVDPVTSDSPVTHGMGAEGVNNLPHIIVSDSESSRASPHPVVKSGNSSSRHDSSSSLPCTTASPRDGPPEPQLSPKNSISTFFSVKSENEAESAVITVVDPCVMPRRRQSTPNATQRHSRLSLVDAVNRLSQISAASGDTEFFDSEDNPGVRQRQISVTEDDGVLRRASSRRKNVDVPVLPLAHPVATEPIAPQEHGRMVRIAEACEVSSDKSTTSVPGSKFSDSSHDCQRKGGPECNASDDIFPDRVASQSKQNLIPTAASPESEARPRKKLTKPRTQSVQAPSGSLPWIPRASPFFKASVKENAPTAENVTQSHEAGDSGKDTKRRTRRLTFQFIPSPSFHKRPKAAPSVPPSFDLTPPTRNETRQRSSRIESGFGTDSTFSSTVTQGSATTITLMPPPPITSSSSVSSSAANSTSSLTGSNATRVSRDTSTSSIVAPSLVAVSRSEQPYFMVPSNLKNSIVARDEATTAPPELQETSSSLSSVSSYVSFTSVSSPGSIPTTQDIKNPPCSPCSRPEAIISSHASVKQAPNSDYLHPMWTVPMATITATSASSRINDISPTIHEPPVQPTFIAANAAPPPAPIPVPTLKTPSTRPHTARLKRLRPQTAPSSPSLSGPVFPTPSVESPHAQKVGVRSSGFKSMFRNLVGRGD